MAQSFTDRSIKITMPGPMTISGTVADAHYGDPRKRGIDIALALNHEILALVEAGARHVQIDEPLFARRPAEALDYGIEHIDRCFDGVPDNITRTVHMCCGYPDALDNPDFPKADIESYVRIASAIEDSTIQAVSIEDAHRHNDSVVAGDVRIHDRDPREWSMSRPAASNRWTKSKPAWKRRWSTSMPIV